MWNIMIILFSSDNEIRNICTIIIIHFKKCRIINAQYYIIQVYYILLYIHKTQNLCNSKIPKFRFFPDQKYRNVIIKSNEGY